MRTVFAIALVTAYTLFATIKNAGAAKAVSISPSYGRMTINPSPPENDPNAFKPSEEISLYKTWQEKRKRKMHNFKDLKKLTPNSVERFIKPFGYEVERRKNIEKLRKKRQEKSRNTVTQKTGFRVFQIPPQNAENNKFPNNAQLTLNDERINRFPSSIVTQPSFHMFPPPLIPLKFPLLPLQKGTFDINIPQSPQNAPPPPSLIFPVNHLQNGPGKNVNKNPRDPDLFSLSKFSSSNKDSFPGFLKRPGPATIQNIAKPIFTQTKIINNPSFRKELLANIVGLTDGATSASQRQRNSVLITKRPKLKGTQQPNFFTRNRNSGKKIKRRPKKIIFFANRPTRTNSVNEFQLPFESSIEQSHFKKQLMKIINVNNKKEGKSSKTSSVKFFQNTSKPTAKNLFRPSQNLKNEFKKSKAQIAKVKSNQSKKPQSSTFKVIELENLLKNREKQPEKQFSRAKNQFALSPQDSHPVKGISQTPFNSYQFLDLSNVQPIESLPVRNFASEPTFHKQSVHNSKQIVSPRAPPFSHSPFQPRPRRPPSVGQIPERLPNIPEYDFPDFENTENFVQTHISHPLGDSLPGNSASSYTPEIFSPEYSDNQQPTIPLQSPSSILLKNTQPNVKKELDSVFLVNENGSDDLHGNIRPTQSKISSLSSYSLTPTETASVYPPPPLYPGEKENKDSGFRKFSHISNLANKPQIPIFHPPQPVFPPPPPYIQGLDSIPAPILQNFGTSDESPVTVKPIFFDNNSAASAAKFKVVRQNPEKVIKSFSLPDKNENEIDFSALRKPNISKKEKRRPRISTGKNLANSNKEQSPKSYQYRYVVMDPKKGVQYGHSESREGKAARGEYFVTLPDGRTQHVMYLSDDKGYKADVKYYDTKEPSKKL